MNDGFKTRDAIYKAESESRKQWTLLRNLDKALVEFHATQYDYFERPAAATDAAIKILSHCRSTESHDKEGVITPLPHSYKECLHTIARQTLELLLAIIVRHFDREPRKDNFEFSAIALEDMYQEQWPIDRKIETVKQARVIAIWTKLNVLFGLPKHHRDRFLHGQELLKMCENDPFHFPSETPERSYQVPQLKEAELDELWRAGMRNYALYVVVAWAQCVVFSLQVGYMMKLFDHVLKATYFVPPAWPPEGSQSQA